MKGGSGPWAKEKGNSIKETLFSSFWGERLNLHRIAIEIHTHI